jgi:hypothetical protein
MSDNRIRILGDTNQCLGVFESKGVISTNCDSVNAQDWTYNTNGEIKNLDGQCLTEDGKGNLVSLESCDGSKHQTWFYDSLQKQIINKDSENCLGVDINVYDGFPNIITNTCQFDTKSGHDNMESSIFENEIISKTDDDKEPTQTDRGSDKQQTKSFPDPCDVECKRNKGQFIILLSLVLVFGVLTVGSFGTTIYVLSKNAKNKKK